MKYEHKLLAIGLTLVVVRIGWLTFQAWPESLDIEALESSYEASYEWPLFIG